MPPLTDSEILKKVKEYLEEEIAISHDSLNISWYDNGFQYWEACSYLLSKITKWDNDNESND